MRVLWLILVSVLLFSCTTKPRGDYILTKEDDLENSGFPGVSKISFTKNFCRLIMTVPGHDQGSLLISEYKVEGDYIYILRAEGLGTLALKMVNSKYLEGEGFLEGTYKRE